MQVATGKSILGGIAIGPLRIYKKAEAQTKHTVEAGHRHGCWVGICGELGADPTLTETFLRMGLDELSVSPSAVLPLRKLIRSIDLSKASEK